MPVFPKILKITNKDFESGLSGWSHVGFDTTTISAYSFSHVTTDVGITYSDRTSSISYLIQNVNIPSSAIADVDTGTVKINFAFAVTKEFAASINVYKNYKEYDETPNARIQTILKFFDGAATEIGSARTSELQVPLAVIFPSASFAVFDENQIPTHDVWRNIELSAFIPANTRNVEISIYTYVSAFDNTEFIIDKAQATLYKTPDTDVEVQLSEAFVEALVQESQTPQSRFTFTGIEVISTVEEVAPPKKPILIVHGNAIVRGNVIIGSVGS